LRWAGRENAQKSLKYSPLSRVRRETRACEGRTRRGGKRSATRGRPVQLLFSPRENRAGEKKSLSCGEIVRFIRVRKAPGTGPRRSKRGTGDQEALVRLAEAFTVPDSRATDGIVRRTGLISANFTARPSSRRAWAT